MTVVRITEDLLEGTLDLKMKTTLDYCDGGDEPEEIDIDIHLKGEFSADFKKKKEKK